MALIIKSKAKTVKGILNLTPGVWKPVRYSDRYLLVNKNIKRPGYLTNSLVWMFNIDGLDICGGCHWIMDDGDICKVYQNLPTDWNREEFEYISEDVDIIIKRE